MNLVKFAGGLKNSKLLTMFGIEEILIHKNWIPICKYFTSRLPSEVFIEEYNKMIKTWGNVVIKNSKRLVDKNRIIYNNWKFDFTPSVFKTEDNVLYTKLPKGSFSIRFVRKNNRIYSIMLPKMARINTNDFIALGLLQGEMITSLNGKSRHYFSFTNSDAELVKIVIDFLRKLGIDKKRLIAQISLNVKKEKKYTNNSYLRYWSKNLSIPDSNFVKISERGMYNTTKEFGSIRIIYHSTLFRLFIQYLLNKLKKFAENDKNIAQFYLSGLFAAEGSVSLSPNNSLNFLSIGGSKSDDVKHYRSLLNCLGIRAGGLIKRVKNEDARKRGWSRGTGGFLMIQGWSNFRIMFEKKICSLCYDKEKKFLYGLLNHREAKKHHDFGEIQYLFESIGKNKCFDNFLDNRNELTEREIMVLNLLKGKGELYAKDLGDMISITKSSASRILNSIHRKGKIKKSGKWKVLWFV